MCDDKIKLISDFLEKVDNNFPVSLSRKVNLSEYAKKLYNDATICVEYDKNVIVAMVAGYTDNLVDNIAYISIVATCEDARGKGLAPKLLDEFLNVCKEKNVDAVHLYTTENNVLAKKLYYKFGFKKYFTKNESRPNDLHLILDLKNREE